MTCCQTCAASKAFDPAVARRDLRRFRRRGPDAATSAILAAVGHAAITESATLLDVGGGVGAIHHVLLERGFSHATQVDASEAYLAAAAEEAELRGHTGRVTFQHADFSLAGGEASPADVVTLNRVVCCDRNGPTLLEVAASKARRAVAFSYPRERWLIRLGIALINAMQRIRREEFRVYLHSPVVLRSGLERAGLKPAWTGGTWVWAVESWVRDATPG